MVSSARRVRQISIITATALLTTFALAYGEASTNSTATAATTLASLDWQKTMSSGGVYGGAGLANLDGSGESVIVGDVNGRIYALHASTGGTVAGWPYDASSGVLSTPATTGSGSSARVYVGVGNSAHPHRGGYLKLTNTGKKSWLIHPYLLPGHRGGSRGVMGSLAVGPIQTSSDVVGGAMGQMQLALNTATGKKLKGFAWLMADTNFSSPALADLAGTGHDYIIEGGDSTKGIADNHVYGRGGHIRILTPTANYKKKHQNSGLKCEYKTDQVVQSSPAVGNFLSGGATGVVVGTGTWYKSGTETDDLIAINTSCGLKWKSKLDGNSLSSPALADVDGLGTSPNVVTVSSKGTLYVLDGATGHADWKIPFGGGARGDVTTFASPSGNFQYIVVPTGNGVFLVNGHTHAYTKIDPLGSSSPVTVNVDNNGKIGLTVISTHGIIQHYTFNDPGSVDSNYRVTTVQTPGAWPMFHLNPQLTGYANNLVQPAPSVVN